MDQTQTDMPSTQTEMPSTQADPVPAVETVEERYAAVEVFGHRRHVGRVMEVDRYGTKMLRIDVPIEGDFAKGVSTHFYGGSAIFSETPCDLAYCKKANTPYRYSQPALMSPAADDADELPAGEGSSPADHDEDE